MIGDALGMTDFAEAERWVVTMIRDAGLDARIDEKNGQVVLGKRGGGSLDGAAGSKYAELIRKTEQVRFRTDILAGACMRHAAEGTL